MGPSDDRGSADSDASLFDAYLDAALAGRPEPPDAFLARHPGAGSALRARIEALHRVAHPASEPHAADPAAPGLPFDRLGDFRLLAPLGEGGMGTVFRAEQETLGRIVALKVIREDLRGSPSAKARFAREAASLAKIRHPGIAQVYAIGEDRGVRFIAMELIEGRSLDDLIDTAARAGRRLPLTDVLRWGAEVADALAATHAAGIVHRDVKPSNVRVAADGRAVLVDFGVARDAAFDGASLTGTFVGSPMYAAPEQVSGAGSSIDGRADVYSLGATLFHCIAGRTSVAPGSASEVLLRIAQADAPSLRSAIGDVPRDVDVVVAKAMERSAARRYATAREFADDLRAILEFRPVQARRAGPAARVARWARRNPASAGAWAAAVVVAAAATLSGFAWAAARREEVRGEARSAVADARTLLEDWDRRMNDGREVEERVAKLRLVENTYWTTDEEDRALHEGRDAVDRLRRERDEVWTGVVEALRRAERLDPATPGVSDVRAMLYLARLREARMRRDFAAERFYAPLVEADDPTGRFADEIREAGAFGLRVHPADAEVLVFRLREMAELTDGADHRVVPVPWRGAPPVPVGTLVLRVTEAAGALRRGDHVIAVGGRAVAELGAQAALAAARTGARVTVHRIGPPFEMDLPAGAVLWPTAAPFLATAECVVPPPHDNLIEVDGGLWAAVVRRDGYEDVTIRVDVRRGGRSWYELDLPRRRPPGFVLALRGVDRSSTCRPTPFWIQEREVTADEYAAFLNATESAAGAAPTRAPRDAARGTPLWPRDAEGRYVVPPAERAYPVVGVSWEDAEAFCRWRSARAAAAGEPWTFRLPSADEWLAAANGRGGRWTYGARFHPKWARTCFATREPGIGPTLSYPIDESLFGVFDLSGGASEWCDGWFDEARGLRRLAGGSWAQGDPEACTVYAARGYAGDAVSVETGFRLCASVPESDR